MQKLVNPTFVELLSIKIIKSTWLIFHINNTLCSKWTSLIYGGFTQWVGLDDWLCQGFLVREACIGVLVHGTGFLFSGVQWSAQ